MEHQNHDWFTTSDDMKPAKTIDDLKKRILSYCKIRKFDILDGEKDNNDKDFCVRKMINPVEARDVWLFDQCDGSFKIMATTDDHDGFILLGTTNVPFLARTFIQGALDCGAEYASKELSKSFGGDDEVDYDDY